MVIIGVVVAVGLVVGIYIYRQRNREDFQKTDSSAPLPVNPNQDACLTLFYGVGCPACQNMKPEWGKAIQKLAGKVKTEQIEDTDPRVSGHGLKVVPTIRFYPNGMKEPNNYIEYQGPRTCESFEAFVAENLK